MGRLHLLTMLILGTLAVPVLALEPKEIVIITNKNVKESAELAEFYCQKRNVPSANVLALDLPTGEDISRADYDKKLAEPVREALKNRRDKIKVLLTLYGVPLRVGTRAPSKEQKDEADKLKVEIDKLQPEVKGLDTRIKQLEQSQKDKPTDETKKALDEVRQQRKQVQDKLAPLESKRSVLLGSETQASVDSELSLLWFPPYDLYRWQINLLYWQVRDEQRKDKPLTLMTARLDGPSLDICKRLVEDALAVEAKGLDGKVYVDARGIKHDAKGSPHGYSGYDQSMRDMATLLDKEGGLKVILDDKGDLFAPKSCPDCALYCGWYSHANYIDCCTFTRGAIAWHLASSEAVSLRRKDAKYWCPNLLTAGVAATLGPVAEPYTVAFPKPGEFFGYLATGEFTLLESYWKTTMLTSWMMVLAGDPLYNPYAKAPKLKLDKVKASPSGWKLELKP